MLTLKQRQERAARRAARIAAKHMAIRSAALNTSERSLTMSKSKTSTKKAKAKADRAVLGRVAKDVSKVLGVPVGVAPTAAKGGPTNALEAHYRAEKDAKLAAYRKEVAEKGAKPDPALDKALADAGKAKAAKLKGQRKPGILALAADVLKDAKAPMDCKSIVEKVLSKGLWQTKGKTPAATLYTAVTMLGKAA